MATGKCSCIFNLRSILGRYSSCLLIGSDSPTCLTSEDRAPKRWRHVLARPSCETNHTSPHCLHFLMEYRLARPISENTFLQGRPRRHCHGACGKGLDAATLLLPTSLTTDPLLAIKLRRNSKQAWGFRLVVWQVWKSQKCVSTSLW